MGYVSNVPGNFRSSRHDGNVPHEFFMTRALVSLVGAGPGHPGLLTVRAVQCLQEADLVLYDKLVPMELLEHLAPRAEKVCVADLGPSHDQRHVPIHDAMISAAKRRRRVVRLKGGDPCIFGRAGEEAQALHAAGIPFEIVPGVTAALGAAAFAGIPLTHRQFASAVALVTGHENPDKPETALDWDHLAKFPGTLVFYMGMSRLAVIVSQLIENGKDPATPAAIVRLASTGDQHTVVAALADLPARAKEHGIMPPALVIIGEVVRLREDLAWFENRPLFGKRVLVTRPKHQAGDLVNRLLTLGAIPFVLPAVEIQPPADWKPVDAALDRLERYQWIVFTSANGVSYFLDRLLNTGKDLRALGKVRLAAIGPKTAAALEAYHLRPDLVPQRFQSEDLAAALASQVSKKDHVLLARADRGRELLHDELARVCHVDQIAVYSQVDAVSLDHHVLDSLRRGEIDFITMTSSNIARSFLQQLDLPCRARVETGAVGLISISPVTSADIRKLGFPIAAEAEHATTEGVVQALVELVRQTHNDK